MGKMQQSLERLLSVAGECTKRTLRVPRWADVRSVGVEAAIESVYQNLGGGGSSLEDVFSGLRNLRAWDIEVDGIALELDEALHFNRYRATTLRSALYAGLKGFPLTAYQKYCAEYESECLSSGSYGGKWSNPSCERQFGSAAVAGNLEGGGSPRWKQRAFYDFVKDLSPLFSGLRLARIAVWDQIPDGKQIRRVADILKNPSASSPDTLLRHVRARVISV